MRTHRAPRTRRSRPRGGRRLALSWAQGLQERARLRAPGSAPSGEIGQAGSPPTEININTRDESFLPSRLIDGVVNYFPPPDPCRDNGDGLTPCERGCLRLCGTFLRGDADGNGNLDITELKKPEMLKGEYAREALKQGLKLHAKFGVNPYKFGFGGATDSHTALATAEEENFFSKSVSVEPSPTRIEHPFIRSELGEIPGHLLVASGYTAVWAEENTRKSIFDAMKRKETYATTGPRIGLRFFGGWTFEDNDLRNRTPAVIGYTKGVPMGGELRQAPAGKSPTFLVAALKDPIGANLDRIQVIKGWRDGGGELHEKVYDVIWADADRRSIGSDGMLPAVGNTVEVANATWTNSIGDSELITVWRDPDFAAGQRAFYYARVLENPTCRWSTWDAIRAGVPPRSDLPKTIQERAWSSPIHYLPDGA